MKSALKNGFGPPLNKHIQYFRYASEIHTIQDIRPKAISTRRDTEQTLVNKRQKP